jgi:hypothetical protein
MPCTTAKPSGNYKGAFVLSDWPCIRAAGPLAGRITVSCKATGSLDLEIETLSGSYGPDISVTPAALHFPDTPPGSAAPPQTVTLSNLTGAPVPLLVAGIGVAGSDNIDYSITSTSVPSACILSGLSSSSSFCPGGFTIDPGQSVTFQVSFSPQKAGAFDADLGIVSNEGSVYSVALYGSGT